MNLVIDDAVEVKQPTKTDPDTSRRHLGMTATSDMKRDIVKTDTDATSLGQILLKGDNVSLIQALS